MSEGARAPEGGDGAGATAAFAAARRAARPLADADPAELARVRVLLFDIDDTFSTDGRIEPEAYDALWAARRAGLRTVPVTGRPAGWCDHLARMWPVDAVIGENGALCFALEPGEGGAASRMTRLWAAGDAERARSRARLEAVAAEVLATVPGARISADQPYRETDLAVDFAEDVSPPLGREAIDAIVRVFERHGATAKVSSIHVNGWFGAWDKRAMAERVLRERFGLDVARPADRAAAFFVGDSPNDEPMFEAFPQCAGVANLGAFAARLRVWPAYLTHASCGAGFAEVVRALVGPGSAARGSSPTA